MTEKSSALETSACRPAIYPIDRLAQRFPWLWAINRSWNLGWWSFDILGTADADGIRARLREVGRKYSERSLWVKLSYAPLHQDAVFEVPDTSGPGCVTCARRILGVVPAGWSIDAIVWHNERDGNMHLVICVPTVENGNWNQLVELIACGMNEARPQEATA